MTSNDDLSALEEAAKLAATVGRWIDSHTATDTSTCQVCPLCQLIARVRESQPEVAEHLVSAFDSLIAAARSALVASEREWTDRPPPSVQRINIGE